MNQKWQLETIFRSRERIRTTQRCTDLHNGTKFGGFYHFIPSKLRHFVLTKAQETHSGKNATEATARMIAWSPGITQDGQRFISEYKNCQMNSPSLGKTVSTWPEADVSEQFHMAWGYVKDQAIP